MCLNVGGWGFKGIDQVKSRYNYYFDIRKEHSFLDKYKLPQKNLFLCILTHWKGKIAIWVFKRVLLNILNKITKWLIH